MTKVIFALINCSLLFVSCNAQINKAEIMKKLYVSGNELFLKNERLRKIELFSKKSDNIFLYKINDDNFIFYSNYDGNWNGMIVFFGKNNHTIIYTSFLLDVDLWKLSNRNYLLRIIEHMSVTLNETTYFLFSDNLDNAIKENISLTSEGAYLLPQDTLTFENIQRTVVFKMKDSICSSKIFLDIGIDTAQIDWMTVESMIDHKQICDIIKIKHDKFIISKQLDTLKWGIWDNNSFVLQKNKFGLPLKKNTKPK